MSVIPLQSASSRPFRTVIGSRGALRIWAVRDDVGITRVTGCFESALVAPFTETITTLLRGKPLHGFHDWSAMDGYDVDTRVALTRWAFEHRRAFASVHLLTPSRLVRLGVQAANVALGGFMHAHASAVTFEEAFLRVTQLPLVRFVAA